MIRAAALGGLLCLLVALPSTGAAEPVLDPLDLYSGRTVVSGTGAANREAGIASCFIDVLVKVSGDPALSADARVLTLSHDAAWQVVRLSYRDRLEGRPVHDEQGTYDRPHYLTVTFDPTDIRADLAALGHKAWQGPRPEVLVDVSVEGRRSTFRLSRDAEADVSSDMKASLASAGERSGLSVALPAGSGEANAGQGQVVLAGTLTWSEQALGWIVAWRLDHAGREHRWVLAGVSFDEAFRAGLRGAAQILSGNGAPE